MKNSQKSKIIIMIKKLDKYPELIRELKKLWNMKMKVISIIVGVLETMQKNLKMRLRELKIR